MSKPRTSRRLISAIWALALVAALVAGTPSPTGDRGLMLAGLGIAAGVLTATRSARVLAAVLLVHATAAAIALDASGTAAVGGFIIAAGYGGAILRTRRGAGAYTALAAAAPVAVAVFIAGRDPGAAQAAAALAPAILVAGLVGRSLRLRTAEGARSARDLAHQRLAAVVARDPERFAQLIGDDERDAEALAMLLADIEAENLAAVRVAGSEHPAAFHH